MLITDPETNRRQAAGCLRVGVVVGIVAALGIVYARHAQETHWLSDRATLEQVAASGDALVRTIERYHARHAQYPPDLAHLEAEERCVLPPKPPEAEEYWEYTVDRGGREYQLAIYLPGDLAPGGYSFWTTLCYRSDRNYARDGFGGGFIDRIGEWAFYGE